MTRIGWMILILLLVLPCVAVAQELGFLGLDVFGGVGGLGVKSAPEDSEESTWRIPGWEAGVTVRFLPWVGVTADVGRINATASDPSSSTYYMIGPTVTTRYTGNFAIRFFGHALAGPLRVQQTSSSSESGNGLMLGGGFDLAIFRIRFDYLHQNLDVTDRNTFSMFLGGVFPMCFRKCRGDEDGWPLSRTR